VRASKDKEAQGGHLLPGEGSYDHQQQAGSNSQPGLLPQISLRVYGEVKATRVVSPSQDKQTKRGK